MTASGGLHRVLANEDHQYCLWPAHAPAPAGWRPVMVGAQAHCDEYLRRCWRSSRQPPGPTAGEPAAPTLPELFDRMAETVPGSVAVQGVDGTLSYARLRDRSDRLARRLRALGVGPESVVGVMLRRDTELLVALLAVLKAGGAYLPLDPVYPPSRLLYMLADSGCDLLLTQGGVGLSSRWAGTVLDLDLAPTSETAPERANQPLPPVIPDQLAYLIYTSGSTGPPKGVQVTHGSLANLLGSMQRRIGLAPTDTLAAITTICFDISVVELFWPLLVGAAVCVLDRTASEDGHGLAERLAKVEATVLQATPVTWQLLLDSGWRPAAPFRMLCGGEALPRELARTLLAAGGKQLWNLYGPTETTVWSTAQLVAGDQIGLGDPLDGVELHLLDQAMRPVPVGETGEIHLGGSGLARGYVGDPVRTARGFVAHPLPGHPGQRLYRTGDLARRTPEGGLEFLGRLDDQLKIHGHRIEPGEVEERIREHHGVRDVAVTAAGDSPRQRHLVAFVVPRANQDEAVGSTPELTEQLRSALGQDLPEHLVPQRYLLVSALPRTANGKLDRRALRLPAHHGGAEPHSALAELPG